MAGENSSQEINNFADDRESLIRHDDDGQILSESVGRHHHLGRKHNRSREVRMIILACLIFGVAITTALIIDIFTGSHHTGHAAVVSDVKECAEVGLDLIKKGGSAVDAAIGSMLCVGVMNPESSGLGGGGFMLSVVPQKEGEVAEVIDFREVAPLAATKDMFNKNGSLASWGGLSVAVPGEIRGYEAAHKKYGKLKWSEVIEPAIKLAKDGFSVTEHTGRTLKNFRKDVIETELGKLVAPNGVFLKEGEKMSNPALADTLKQIADKGADAFYNGPIADSIVAAVQSANGIITKADLSGYKPLLKNAINATYLGYQVITTPLPSGGPVLVSMLNILDGFNFTKKDRDKSVTYHYIVEAMKFAFAQRSLLEDSKELTNISRQMLSKEFADSLRAKISPNKTFPLSYYVPFLDQTVSHGTAHVSVIGPDGDLASVTRYECIRIVFLVDGPKELWKRVHVNGIAGWCLPGSYASLCLSSRSILFSTINGYFGSGIMTQTGIILNNEMGDFSIPGVQNIAGAGPPKANFVAPGKRPLSSMVPTAVLHKEKRCWFRMSLGGAGAFRITPAVAEVLVNNLALNYSLSEAIENARVYYSFTTGLTEIEADKFPDKKKASRFAQDLRDKGHNVTEDGGVAEVNALSYYQEKIAAHADSRRGGAQGSAQY